MPVLSRYFGIGAIVALAVAWYGLSGNGAGPAPSEATTEATAEASAEATALVLPDLTPEQQLGRDLFVSNCAICHGPNASGSEQGPPLVHRIYEPSHHGDMSFVLAARQGVRAHHWDFGNMPAVDSVTDAQVLQIIAYVRALQRANGIN